MKILVCTFSFPFFKHNVFDGRFVYSETIGYAKNGATVLVITPSFPGAEEYEHLDERIKVIRFSYFFPKSWQVLKQPGKPIYDVNSVLSIIQIPLLLIAFSYNILKYAKEYDIIHAQWSATAILAFPAKWLFKKIMVMTVRGSDIRLLPKWINKYIHRKVDAVIDCFATAPWNVDNKRSFPANYIKLPLLVYDDASGKVPKEVSAITTNDSIKFILLYLGRFHPQKMIENHLPLLDLIHVSNILKAKEFNFHLFYLGDGPVDIVNQMRQLIKGYNLSDFITILGPRINVFDYIHLCSLGIGGIALNGVSQEFTICKKPQILVDLPENADLPWRQKTNCLFIKPDAIKDLEEKIVWAIRNPFQMIQIGKKSTEDMRTFFVAAEKGGSEYMKVLSAL